MDDAAREPFQQKAKQAKEQFRATPPEQRPAPVVNAVNRLRTIMTSQGVPVSELERERNERIEKEKAAKLRIRQMVENGFDLDSEL